jgi:ribosome-associated protein
MPLVVSPEVTIPDSDLSMAFVRASGPGGQNVNKVASAVQLRFDLDGSSALNERVKTRLRRLAGRRLTDEGSILIIARSHREQERNRQDALDRLGELVREALIEPKIRRPTKPTRSSKERRITGKVKQGRNKQLRSKVRWDD